MGTLAARGLPKPSTTGTHALSNQQDSAAEDSQGGLPCTRRHVRGADENGEDSLRMTTPPGVVLAMEATRDPGSALGSVRRGPGTAMTYRETRPPMLFT